MAKRPLPFKGGLRSALVQATSTLAEFSETPRLDAELLAAHALGISRETLLLTHLDDPSPETLGGLIARRAKGEPIAYITGTRDFWTITLHVAPGVLIPRPDSETLIEAAVAHFDNVGPKTVLDLGTGSGALLLAALDQWPEARGVGIDRSPETLIIARDNAARLGMSDRAQIIEGDWAAGISGPFDLILCNPPYIEMDASLPRDVAAYEPAQALYAGQDGLDAYRLLAPEAGRLLAPGGLGLFEIGADQGAAVMALFAEYGPRLLRDLAGRDRCIAINRSAI